MLSVFSSKRIRNLHMLNFFNFQVEPQSQNRPSQSQNRPSQSQNRPPPARTPDNNGKGSRRPTGSSGSCWNQYPCCQVWASTGRCEADVAFMKVDCKASCRFCQPNFDLTIGKIIFCVFGILENNYMSNYKTIV
jgi:hypothetical protein